MKHNTPVKTCLICEKSWKAKTWAASFHRCCLRCRKKRVLGQPINSRALWLFRSRITRVRRKGNYQRIFYIQCYAKFCTNEVLFRSQDDGKKMCRFCMICPPVKGKVRVNCRNRLCKKTVSIKRSVAVSGRKVACSACSVKRIHGHPIGRFDVWSLRHFCTQIVRSPTGKRQFLITCKLRNCSRTYVYRSRHQGKRQFCGEHSKRMYGLEDYGSLYGLIRRAVLSSPIKTLDLSYDEFKNFCETKKRCVYCKKKVTRKRGGLRRGKDNFAYYIDRLDRTKGYNVNNIVTACDSCNLTKSDKLSPQEMAVVAAMRGNRISDAQRLAAEKRPPKEWPSKVWKISDRHWRGLRKSYLKLRTERRLVKLSQACRSKAPKR